MEWVTKPNAESGVFVREDLCHIIVSNELSLMELGEYPFSEVLLYYLKVYLCEAGEYVVYPVTVSYEPV